MFDDYSFLREINPEDLKKKEAELFSGRNALLFVERPGHGFSEKGSRGASYFTAKNPPFGAVFTYYLTEEYKSLRKTRRENEKDLDKQNKKITFPGWDKVEAERRQDESLIWLTVKDREGNVVRKIKGKNKRGFNRTAWDLKYPNLNAIDSQKDLPKKESNGYLASPGDYTVSLSKQIDGVITELAGPISFTVEKLYNGSLKGSEPKEALAYAEKVTELQKQITAASLKLNKSLKKVDAFQLVVSKTSADNISLAKNIHSVEQKLYNLDEKLNGSRSKIEVGEKNNPTILYRLDIASKGVSSSTYGPTNTQKKSLEITKKLFAEFEITLSNLVDKEISAIEQALLEAGAPIVK